MSQYSDSQGETVCCDRPPAGCSVPPCIGGYKILRVLGEGGMGVVYLAEQTEPVRRRVAIKVIKLGMDTCQVIARFEAERQALAMMDHPNVARVFDGGATQDGRPYFVMEYVPGAPITEYCDRHKLTTRARIELFIQVCHAIQHAHQKGIIHRDLKPSNVLVEHQDGGHEPKVIDFGIAKATTQRLTERTLHTEHGRPIGTPAYMSPEQADMGGLNVDTRTDIYSLGAMLYELLTGALPFDPKMLSAYGPGEMHRILREMDPPRPSTRVGMLMKAENGDGAATGRRTDKTTTVQELRGDLDWITMKALARDRMQRYSSASELAAELERHRNNEPVLAGPPSPLYRLRKFSHRNRGAVIAATAILIVILGSLVVTARALLRAMEAEVDLRAKIEEVELSRTRQAEARARAEAERERAVAMERMAEERRAEAEAAHRAAAIEARKAKAINDVLTKLLASGNPSNATSPAHEESDGVDEQRRD